MNDTSSTLNQFTVIIPAAGKGTRLGTERPKAFYPIHDHPMLFHSLSSFYAMDGLSELILVHPPNMNRIPQDESLRNMLGSEHVITTPGGNSRFESVENGFRARTEEADIVLVHDAARPLVSKEIIHRVLHGVKEYGAAIAAISIPDTVKRVREECIEETVDRSNLYRAQTPQGFRTDWFQESLASCSEEQAEELTDDASIVSEAGYPVHIVEGDQTNFKITYPGDVQLAERLIAQT